MPTYRNVSSIKRLVANRVVEPGAIMASPIIYDSNEAGLLKVSDLPSYNPTLISVKVDKGCEIGVPLKDGFGNNVSKYSIHLYVESGEVDILFNDVKNVPSLQLYTGAKWNLRCMERTIDKFFVSSDVAFVLWVIIERLL